MAEANSNSAASPSRSPERETKSGGKRESGSGSGREKSGSRRNGVMRYIWNIVSTTVGGVAGGQRKGRGKRQRNPPSSSARRQGGRSRQQIAKTAAHELPRGTDAFYGSAPLSAVEGGEHSVHHHQLHSSSWLSGIILGLWDNTCGPRIDQVWINPHERAAEEEASLPAAAAAAASSAATNNNIMDEEIQHYAVRLTLSSEIGATSEEENSRIDTKFHLFSELGITIISTTFTVVVGSSEAADQSASGDGAANKRAAARRKNLPPPTKYTFILISREKYLERILEFYDAIEDRTFRLCSIIKSLLVKSLPANLYTPHLLMFVSNLNHLFVSSINRFPAFRSTVFWDTDFDRDFLALAITGLLHSGGNCVVLGNNSAEVRRMIESLSLFLMHPEQRARSSYPVVGRGYVPDLFLQGVVVDAVRAQRSPSSSKTLLSSNHKLTAEQEEALVMNSLLPTAVVDLTRRQVKITNYHHEYSVLRREFAAAELTHLLDQAKKDARKILQSVPQTIVSKSSSAAAASGGSKSGSEPESNEGLPSTAEMQELHPQYLTYYPGVPNPSTWKGHQESLFKPLRHAAPLVRDIVDSVFELPRSLREGYLLERVRGLKKMAVTLLKCIDYELRKSAVLDAGTVLRIKNDIFRRQSFVRFEDYSDSEASPRRDMSESRESFRLFRRSTSSLHSADSGGVGGSGAGADDYANHALLGQSGTYQSNADVESDFLSVLSIAERLAPGTYLTMAGDPDILESKFVELFESF